MDSVFLAIGCVLSLVCANKIWGGFGVGLVMGLAIVASYLAAKIISGG